MQFTFTPRIKRLIIVATCVVIIAVVGWLLYMFFNQATITVTTKSVTGSMSLFRSFPTRETISVKLSNGTSTLRVPAGSYTVTLIEGDASAQQNVELRAGDNKTIALNIQRMGVVEPVSSMSGGFMIASKNKLRFVNRSGNAGLYSIDESNRLQPTDTSFKYRSASWADTSFGVAKVVNSSGDQLLVAIDNDAIKTVNLPFKNTSTLSYSIASNRDLYVSDGHAVYSGTVEEGFNKIYESSDQVTVNAASPNAVLVSQQGPISERTTGLVVLQKDGQKFQIGGEVYEAAWSPSGNRLVTSGDTSEVFDKSLKRITSLPRGNVNSPVWLDDDRIVYGITDKLWLFTLSTGHASAIASVGGTGAISQLAPDIDGSYLYISMQKTDTRRDIQFRILRIGLAGQDTLNPLAQKLATVFPYTLNDCSIGYVNFLRTSVTANNQGCIQKAKDLLNSYGVDQGSLDFYTTK